MRFKSSEVKSKYTQVCKDVRATCVNKVLNTGCMVAISAHTLADHTGINACVGDPCS